MEEVHRMTFIYQESRYLAEIVLDNNVTRIVLCKDLTENWSELELVGELTVQERLEGERVQIVCLDWLNQNGSDE